MHNDAAFATCCLHPKIHKHSVEKSKWSGQAPITPVLQWGYSQTICPLLYVKLLKAAWQGKSFVKQYDSCQKILVIIQEQNHKYRGRSKAFSPFLRQRSSDFPQYQSSVSALLPTQHQTRSSWKGRGENVRKTKHVKRRSRKTRGGEAVGGGYGVSDLPQE